MEIPKRKRGKPSKDAQERFVSELNDFIQLLFELMIRATSKWGAVIGATYWKATTL
jgi:hypothetical protein